MNVLLWLLYYFYFQVYFLFMKCPLFKAPYTYFYEFNELSDISGDINYIDLFFSSLYCLFSLHSFYKFLGFGLSYLCKIIFSKLCDDSCLFIVNNVVLVLASLLSG